MSPSPVTSTPILRTSLISSAIAAVGLAIIAAVAGGMIAGTRGVWSGLTGVLIAVAFLAITAISILVANRWYGDPLYTPIFFGAVMGGWIVKFALFIVVLFVLRGAPWLNNTVFFIALVVSVIASLAIDVVVMLKMRVPHVGDVTLPTLADIIDEARRPSVPEMPPAPPEEGGEPARSTEADENPPRG